MSLIRHETIGNVRLLTLNRPDAGNRISAAMALELIALLEAADQEQNVSAIVLTGAGDVFCVGGDPLASGPSTEEHLAFSAAFSALTRTILGLGTPVLAAVRGDAHAGGFSILMCCDLAVVSEATTLALPELHAGLFPILAMATVQPFLPRKLFFDLVYSGRRLSADEAAALFLVNEVVPADAVVSRAVGMAQMLAQTKRTAIRIGRQTYDVMAEMDLDSALEHARYVLPTLLAAVGQDEASKEGVE